MDVAQLSAEEQRLHREYVMAHRKQILRRHGWGETPAQMSKRYGVGSYLLHRMLDRWLSGPDGWEPAQ
ncbi:hypothetical protein [Streptomyces sp. NPDC059994]|uniref:hypothetical protein n=1 Tax=Streptomyces sp. NPDC059994 TaxID=3347029 RepID=UPI00369740ED